ncbi:MAG: hypothetical protein IE921_08390 [Rhodobacteraceae bacterium]|nr:hypothetical protein [Paracoccaceae bacterium]
MLTRTANRRRAARTILALMLALAAGLALWWALHARAPQSLPPAQRQPVALLTSLPIYWPESGNMGELLAGDAPLPWPRAVLERRYRLEPLDVLAASDGGESRLGPFRYLILAQPRALTPAENVALDDWVRGGGRLLLFADPLLVAESRYPLGDPRAPQGAVLLSPILARWGLELRFDEAQPQGTRTQRLSLAPPVDTPVNMAGHFVLQPGFPNDTARCKLADAGLLARCSVGQGAVLVLADAQLLLPPEAGDGALREAALAELAETAFR